MTIDSTDGGNINGTIKITTDVIPTIKIDLKLINSDQEGQLVPSSVKVDPPNYMMIFNLQEMVDNYLKEHTISEEVRKYLQKQLEQKNSKKQLQKMGLKINPESKTLDGQISLSETNA